jgi:hypothetical protein
MERMVLPEPPRKAAIMIRGKFTLPPCFEMAFKNQKKLKPAVGK